jgi:predicted HD superfamily hydrolase involved in NAD metabolism
MWSEDEIQIYLKKNLNRQRLEHSLRVRDTSIELAKHYNVDTNKACIAGLVHDCAKNMSDSEILDLIYGSNYQVDEVSKISAGIMHGLAGAIVAKNTMGINDEEVLDSIAYHTTGREKMSTLEKIIYLADYIEPMRDFPGVDELRKASYEDLDEALLLSFNNTIKYIINRGQLIHKDTIDARNYILIEKMR